MTIAVQSDGKIIVGGVFIDLDGNSRNNVVRLNSDGTEDTAFYTNTGSAFDGDVLIVAVESGGKILLGGLFNQYDGLGRNFLVRLNSNGTEDTAFYTNLGSAFNNDVVTISVHTDGDVVVGGEYTSFNGNTRNRIIRLTSDPVVSTSDFVSTSNEAVEIQDLDLSPAEFCSSDTFQVKLSADDAIEYLFSVDDPLFLGTNWLRFEGEVTLDVSTPEMVTSHTVYAKFRSRTGNKSATMMDSVECSQDLELLPSTPEVGETCAVPEDFPHLSGVALKSTDSEKVYLFGESGCIHWYENEDAYFEYWDSFSQLTLVETDLLEQLEVGTSIAPPATEVCTITLYTGPDYRGLSQVFTADSSDFRAEFLGNDTASSARVTGGEDCSVTLFEHIDYKGISETFITSDPDLSDNPVKSDNVSSLKFSD